MASSTSALCRAVATKLIAACASSLVIALSASSLSGGGIGVLTLALSGVRSLRFGRLFPPVLVERPPRLLFWFEASEEFSLASVDSELFVAEVFSVADCAVAESVELVCADFAAVPGLDVFGDDAVDPIEFAGVAGVEASSFKGSSDGMSLGTCEESSFDPVVISAVFTALSFASDGAGAGLAAGVGP